MRISLAVALFPVVAVFSCGAPSGDGPSESTSSAVSALDEATTTCPSSPPTEGEACSPPKDWLFCSWGDDPRWGCRQEAVCGFDGAHVWQLFGGDCSTAAPKCPPKAPTSTTCGPEDHGITCVYDDVAYTCADCEGTLCFQDFSWYTTTLDAGCPSTLPNWGTSCEAKGLGCNYNECADGQPGTPIYGVGTICEHGVWTEWNGTYGGAACP